jgi:uncharacterized membrane protein (DUF485 family)
MILLFPALILFILGYLVKVKKMTFLISGYNLSSTSQQEKYNVDELTKQVGNFVYSLSYIMFIWGLSLMLFSDYESPIMTVGSIFLAIYSILGIIFLNLNKSIYK